MAYVRACGGDCVGWEARWHELVTELAPAAPAAESELGAPYLGLATFEPHDAQRFFGREPLVEQLVRQVAELSFLAVFAPSGAGKSSLLRAGLLPRIAADTVAGGPEWVSILVTPGERPVEELAVHLANANSVAAGAVYAALAADPVGIRLAVRQILAERAKTARLLIVVDQFEEVFTHCRQERDRSDFIAILLAAAEEPNVRVVLGVRADFYARCLVYPELMAALHGRQVLVGPLDDDGLRQVITGPALDAGLTVEPALVEVVVGDAGGQPGALPLMSHALLETWRRRRGTRLTLADYQAAGGVRGAIAQTAERVYGKFDEIERLLTREIFLRLTALGEGTEDTRRRAARAELVDGPDAPRVCGVLSRLTAARLVTLDDECVTVAHEALIQEWPRLRGWLAEDRDLLRSHRRLTEAATEWDQHRREEGFLYRGARLAMWQERQTIRLNEVEHEFLTQSRAHEARELQAGRRRRRLALAGLSVTVAVVSLLAAVALVQADRAANERDLALSRQLTAESRGQLQLDPQRALDLARQAYTVQPTVEAELALRQAVADYRTRAVVPVASGQAFGVAFSPDGRSLAATGAAGEVSVWAWTGESVAERRVQFQGHAGRVWSPAFSPDGARLATAGSDGTVRIWRTDGSGTPVVLAGHTGPVWAVVFSPDGRRVASAGEDATVRIWDAYGIGTPTILRGHQTVAVGVAFSPDGQRLASTSHDGTVRIWDLVGRSDPIVLHGPQAGTKTVLFSPDGARLASASSDGTAWVWPVDGAGTPVVLRGHEGTVEGLAISPDGRWLATTSDDTTVRVWNAAGTGEPLILRGHKHTVWSVAFSPDGTRLASASEDGTIRIWDPRGAGDPVLLRGHAGAVWTAVFTPDGQRVISGGEDRTVRVWDPSGRADPLLLGDHDQEVFELRMSADGRRVASASRDGTIRIWDATGTGKADPIVLRGHEGPAWIADFSPDGNLIASAGSDGTLRIWNTTGDHAPLVRRAETGQIRHAAFSPDGKHVATAGEDGTVRIWDTTGQTQPLILHGHQGFVWAVAYSPDGHNLASVGVDGTVRVWSTTNDRPPLILRGHHGFVWYVTYSPDGRWIASTGKDASVRLWQTVGAATPITYRGFGASVETIHFSPDSSHLLTTHDDGTIRIWRCHACDPIDQVLAKSKTLDRPAHQS